ncbi:ABC transporter permease [Microbacteriaceae bacterium 4G12]
MNTNKLWKQRFQLFLKEVRTYGKYIFNDHLKFVIIFAIGVGAYYYQQWLQTLTPSFPTALVLACLFALVLTAGSVQTLLKPADLIFLLPLEEKMKPYFRKAFQFTYIVQLYAIGLVAAAAAPLYFQQLKQPGSSYILLVLLALLVKAWNLFVTWEIGYATDEKARIYDWLARFSMNALFVYFVVNRAFILYTGSIVIVMAFYLLLLHRKNKRKGFHWEHLIHEEGKKMLLFYRIANLFTDVPVLKERVKRRKWLDFIVDRTSFSKSNPYFFLYVRTFLRSGDYLGLFIRLLVLGGVIVYVIPFVYGRLFVSVLFLYLIGYQLLSLWKHYRSKIWLDLYPLSEESRKKAFLSLLLRLLLIGSVVFTVISLLSSVTWSVALLLFIVNIIFSYAFTYGYCSKKMNSLL